MSAAGDSIDSVNSRQNEPGKNLIRSKHADIMIKVDADIYHLDRLLLACKSDYFEKLFIEDFREKKVDYLEFSIMDSDTFSAIVDIIYGQELKTVLNTDNYVSLLMAMDYLQMKVDQRAYGNFVKNFIQKKPSLDLKLFSLCEYLAENKNYNVLMPFVYTCLSTHLAEVRDHEEFLSLPLNHVVGIISGQRFDILNMKDIRQCGEVCVKWILHDAENRLPRAVELVNAVKRRFNFPHRANIEDFKIKMRNTGEEVTPDTVLSYFMKFIFYQGEIGMSHVVTRKMLIRRRKYDTYDWQWKKDPIDQNERDKLTRFLENGDLYDIVVRVQGKAYKLHRCKLLSESGYFANVFSSEICETTGDPNKDEEYLLNVEGVDQSSFDVSIRYIYHKKLELNSDTIVGVLKTACILKIVRLVGDCESWIIKNLREISFKVVFEILNFICISNLIGRFEHLYKCLLSRRVLKAWSAVDDFSSFCAIPLDMLEDLLISSVLHMEVHDSSLLENFSFNDPDKYLDICSKWVMGDVQNRYNFIPRIALAINCNLMVNCNDYKMETTPDLNNCPEQFVRDQLLKVLLSTSLIPRDTSLKNISREIKDNPVFITSSRTVICLLNAEVDEIVSLWFFNEEELRDNDRFRDNVSASVMGDNLFIAANVADNYSYRIFFQAFNISSKKFTSLAYLPCITGGSAYVRYVLLNCRDNIYCCFGDGQILKYWTHFNRWTIFSGNEQITHYGRLRFISDGKSLYKLYETKIPNEDSPYIRSTDKFFETYDFDKNSWIPVPEMTIHGNVLSDSVIELINMNSGNVGVCFSNSFWIFDQNSRSWRQLALPISISCDDFMIRPVFTQYDDTLLLIYDDKLYSYQLSDLTRSWQIKKENVYDYDGPLYEYFGCFASVHTPSNQINAGVL